PFWYPEGPGELVSEVLHVPPSWSRVLDRAATPAARSRCNPNRQSSPASFLRHESLHPTAAHGSKPSRQSRATPSAQAIASICVSPAALVEICTALRHQCAPCTQ